MRYSRTGREIYAIGSSPTAAVLRGIAVRRTIVLIFTITGALSGIAGIMWASRFPTINPGSAGAQMELIVISAVVIGGVNVFGGGLALYSPDGTLVGGLGVSGDTSCADHNVAYRTRHTLQLDWVPAGVSGNAARRDTIVYDIVPQAGQMPGVSPSGWGHPGCFAPDVAAEATLPDNR